MEVGGNKSSAERKLGNDRRWFGRVSKYDLKGHSSSEKLFSPVISSYPPLTRLAKKCAKIDFLLLPKKPKARLPDPGPESSSTVDKVRRT